MILRQHARIETWRYAALLAATFALPIEAQELPAPRNTMPVAPETQSLDALPSADESSVLYREFAP